MEDHPGPPLDLSHAAPDIIVLVLGSMPLRDRCNCALVCKAWAEAATAATHSIVLEHRTQDLRGLQAWLSKHGSRLEVLQLHAGCPAALTALPCCAKLQDLLLHGLRCQNVSIARRMWGDVASATKLTSISLTFVQTAAQQADVVAALTALPNLEQLTWHNVCCSNQQGLSDSSLLQQMTRLTSLDLWGVTAAALQHLGSLTKLQHLGISDTCTDYYALHEGLDDWTDTGCPGLQELRALTSLVLFSVDGWALPASVSQLTALQQLEVSEATPTALNRLQVLTNLTALRVQNMTGLSSESPPLKLPGLQHLELRTENYDLSSSDDDDVEFTTPMSFLASCTRLQVLKLDNFQLKGGCSLVASTMLQHLEVEGCTLAAADGAADPASWQQVFPGPGQLPHLTYLRLPALQQADMGRLVECCSSLKGLHLDTLQDSCAPALARLPCLTKLCLVGARDQLCSALVQLTGLRQLAVWRPAWVSAVGLRQLAALSQLISLGFGRFYRTPLDTLAQHLMKDNLPEFSYGIINKVCVWYIVCARVALVCVHRAQCVALVGESGVSLCGCAPGGGGGGGAFWRVCVRLMTTRR